MLGDIIIWIKRVWKQQTCVHKYKYVLPFMRGVNCPNFEQCTKCDRIK